MGELSITVNETIQAVEEVTALFYQQNNQEGMRMLELLIGRIVDTVSNIQQYQAGLEREVFSVKVFNDILSKALKAMEQKDMILFSDILFYEINSMFREFLIRYFELY